LMAHAPPNPNFRIWLDKVANLAKSRV